MHMCIVGVFKNKKMSKACFDDMFCSVVCFLFFQFYKKKSGVVVFQQSSRGENMMLDILPREEEELVCFFSIIKKN